MRLLFRTTAAAFALTTLSFASPVSGFVDLIEAEEGMALNPACSPDGERAGPVHDGFFLPHAGCEALFLTLSTVAAAELVVTFKIGGRTGTLCGTFEVEGGYMNVGPPPVVCGPSEASLALTLPLQSLQQNFLVLRWAPIGQLGMPPRLNPSLNAHVFGLVLAGA